MRTIETHKVRDDEKLTITVTDEPGPGGASHRYHITGLNLALNESWTVGSGPQGYLDITFQRGGIPDHGTNGVTNEALLAIIIDRLWDFQMGPFPSERNAKAIECCQWALAHLKNRTRERLKRGVEGQEKA